MTRSDNDIDALLARGKLSGARRDAIFDQIATALRPRRRSRAALWSTLAATFAVATAVVIVPRLRTGPAELRAKGTVASLVQLACLGGETARCPMGGTLAFTFDLPDSSPPLFVAAYAEPVDRTRQRVWYFSADDQTASVQGTGPIRLDQGVRIGPEHGPGDYVVHLMLTAVPLPRAALLNGDPRVLARHQLPLRVVAS